MIWNGLNLFNKFLMHIPILIQLRNLVNLHIMDKIEEYFLLILVLKIIDLFKVDGIILSIMAINYY